MSFSTAKSFAIRAQSPAVVARAFDEAAGTVARPSGAFVFLAGAVADRLDSVTAALARPDRDFPVLIATGAGVLSERGELEGDSAASGLVWSGGSTDAVCVRGRTGAEWGAAMAALAVERAAGHPALVLFAKHEGFTPDALEPLGDVRGLANVFGGGTVSTPAVAVIDRGGRVTRGDAAGMFLHGACRPVVRTATACRLLTALAPVTATRGSMVLRVGDLPALDVLEQAGKKLEGQQQQILVVLADPATDPERRPELLVRAVQGVDPSRRGLVIGDEVRPGLRMALAVRDANAARTELESAVREVARESAGGAPRFGLYINCAGRGAALYGQRDVDTRIVKARFGDLPLAGLQSSFEIAPHMGRPAFQLYTGVLGLFSAPS